MADSTIKPDSGNDLVLQNNGGTGKIEVNDGGEITVTLGGSAGDDLNIDSNTLVVSSDTNRVGVGIAEPVEEVHITGDDPTLLIEHTASSYGEANLKLGNDSGTNASTIQYDTTQASLYVKNLYPITAGTYGRIFFQQNVGGSLTDVLTIDNRNVSINDGNLVIGTGGHGIDFSAQTTSSTGSPDTTAGAEVLDHYETGLFTPELYCGTTKQTLSREVGGYIKIGDFCHVQISIIVNGAISGSGAMQIHNLPFAAPACDSAGHARTTGIVGYTNASINPMGILSSGNTILDLWTNSTAGSGGTLSTLVYNSDVPSSWNIHLSISMSTFPSI